MSTAVCTSILASVRPLARPAAVPPAVRRGAWQLDAGHAMSLKALPARASCGSGRAGSGSPATPPRHPPAKTWCWHPGESLAVAAGERIVMEPWDGYGATYSWDAAA